MSGREWCWTCNEQRSSGDGRYLHRADNPVLAHGRCAVCDDVLLPFPQPSLPDKLERLGRQIAEAYQWTQVVATEQPDHAQEWALREIAQFLLEAQRVYREKLERLT